jgi:hypothetical protein
MGQPQFQQMLASDDLMQLRQRVIASFHLGPLSVEETQSYIEHRLQLVNWKADPALLTDAFARVHYHSGGVPRRINVLCDRMLLGGMLEELHEIDAAFVDNVASEMSTEGANAVSKPRHDLEPMATAAPSLNGNTAHSADLDRRLASVEKLVRVHDRTIKRALDLAASYFNADNERAPGGPRSS